MTYDCKDLTERQRKFCEEYIVDLNGRAAAERAGYAPNGGQVTNLLKLPHVKAYVDYLSDERAKRVGVTSDFILERLLAMATVDVNDLVQYRRHCCRHCYGEDFRYQWTDAEYERAVKEATDRHLPIPEAPGGNGYDRTKDANPDCPECRGQGKGEVFAADTRKMSPEAKMLYDGAKVGRDGLEIKTLDRLRIYELIGKHIGMFKDKVEHSGKIENTGPVLNLTLAAPPGTKIAENSQEPTKE
jgi:phage terminase small subunit